MKNKILKYLKNKYVIAGLVVLVIIIIYLFARGGGASKLESATVVLDNVTEEVSVTGKVLPTDKADLAFERSGVVTRIAVRVGDQVQMGSLIASLDSADDVAAVANAEAQLADLTRGLRPEEYAADQSAVAAANTALASAQAAALDAAHNGYVEARSAVTDESDTFFNNPQSVNPTINVGSLTTNQQTTINNERLKVNQALTDWQTDLTAATAGSAGEVIDRSASALTVISDFETDLSQIINRLNSGDLASSRTALDTAVSTMNTALADLNQATAAVTTARNNLRDAGAKADQAESQFKLEQAGASTESIAAAAARVTEARATLAKDSILSPITGTVTRVDPQVGEFVPAGQSAFTVQSDNLFKMEAYVAEADIAKVALNDAAAVTLDAYGSGVAFPATVSAIDPAETVLEGVSTYKVTLLFNQPDARIRSGMTANIDILTHEAKQVLAIPSRAILDDNGVKTVRVLNSGGQTFSTTTVTVGLKGSNGLSEIKSGLRVGQQVVTYIKP